jgi:Cupredoxin-like domain
MEDRTMVTIIVIVGAVALMAHAGHISTAVSGAIKHAPVIQTSGSLSQPGIVVSSGNAGNGTVETFTMRSSGGQYDPAVIRVKQGTTVRIEGDPQTLSGCMEVVNIDGCEISKRIAPGDNIIEFPADKAGTFPIRCNMGIGNGKLVVSG